MKRLTCSLLVLCMLLSLAACGSKPGDSSSPPSNTPNGNVTSAPGGGDEPGSELFPERTEPITVTFWHSNTQESIVKTFTEIVDSFNALDNNITVELVQYSSADDLNTAVTGAIMSGTAPDLVMGSTIYIIDYLNAGALVDMTPYIESEEYGLDLSDFYDCWLENSNNYDIPGYYGLPMLPYSEVVYYNKTFFEEHNYQIPETWEDMEALCRQIKADTGITGFGWDNHAKMFTTMAEQAGAGYTDSKGNLLFTETLDTVVDKVSWYNGLVQEGIFRTAGESHYFSGPFANQEIPMYIGSGVESMYLDQKIDPNNPFTWSTFPVPYFANEGKRAVFCENHELAIIDQNEPDYDKRLAAWEFVRYFETGDAALKMAQVGAYLPALKSVAASDEWLSSANDCQLTGASQMEYFYPFYGFDNGRFTSSAIYSDLRSYMGDVLENGADLQGAIDTLLGMYGS